MLDAVVVGAGPNGLAAALTLARAGRSVTVLEANDVPGGGARSVEVTEPGVIHDHCASVVALGLAGPFLPTVPGVDYASPTVEAAHPLDDEPAVLLHRDPATTAAGLGADGDRYLDSVGELVRRWDVAGPLVLGPVARIPSSPFTSARLGRHLVAPAASIVGRTEDRYGPLLAGMAAHGGVPLGTPFTAGVALALLAAGHVAGWSFVSGGIGRLVDAMISELEDLGGELRCGRPVRSAEDLLDARVVLMDTSPGAAASVLGLRGRVGAALRGVRHGAGVWKVDWLLDGPIPWADPSVGGAGTVHLGGSAAEIGAALDAVDAGGHPERPYVLLTQPTVADPSRAPDGRHVAWAYCHVPNGSTVDRTAAIEAQVERFAPGFADRVIARATLGPAGFEADNANLVGGDIANGAPTPGQLIARPRLSSVPWRLGDGAYLCSAATPPGPGIHGMCGVHAAEAALARELA